MPSHERRRFEQLIEEANRIDGLENRTQMMGGYPVRAERIEETHNVWIGEMIKVRMDELPVRVGPSSPITELGLRDDEGVGEPNGFLYDPSTRVMVTHGEHYGVSAVKMVEYFAEATQCRSPIEVEPVLREDAWQKFNRMTTAKAFSFRIGRNINRNLLTGASHSLNRSLETLGNYDGLQVEVTVSVGRSRKHGMDKEQMKTDISALVACHEENAGSVEKLEVRGLNPEDLTDEVDFLQGRMKVVVDVPLGSERRLTYERRKNQLLKARRESSDELERIYGELSER